MIEIGLHDDGIGIGRRLIVAERVYRLAVDVVGLQLLAGIEVNHRGLRDDTAFTNKAVDRLLPWLGHGEVMGDAELVRLRREQPVVDNAVLFRAMKLAQQESRK